MEQAKRVKENIIRICSDAQVPHYDHTAVDLSLATSPNCFKHKRIVWNNVERKRSLGSKASYVVKEDRGPSALETLQPRKLAKDADPEDEELQHDMFTPPPAGYYTSPAWNHQLDSKWVQEYNTIVGLPEDEIGPALNAYMKRFSETCVAFVSAFVRKLILEKNSGGGLSASESLSATTALSSTVLGKLMDGGVDRGDEFVELGEMRSRRLVGFLMTEQPHKSPRRGRREEQKKAPTPLLSPKGGDGKAGKGAKGGKGGGKKKGAGNKSVSLDVPSKTQQNVKRPSIIPLDDDSEIVDWRAMLNDTDTCPSDAYNGWIQYEGINYQFANSAKRVELVGGHDRACKIFGHKMRGFNACLGVRDPRLCHSPSILVEYMGYRVWCQGAMPIDAGTIVYGTHGNCDPTDPVRKSDQEASVIVKGIAEALNLKGHWVGEFGRDERRYLFTNVDIAVHRGSDNRIYLADGTERLFPPITTLNEQFPQGYLYRHMRPELVAGSKKARGVLMPLSSDAMSPFGLNRHEEHDREVAMLTEIYTNPLLVDCANDLIAYIGDTPQLPKTVEKLQEVGGVGAFLHARGVNIRSLGFITTALINRYYKCKARLVDADPLGMLPQMNCAVELLRMEMIQRAVKSVIQGCYRERLFEEIYNTIECVCKGKAPAQPMLQYYDKVVWPMIALKYGKDENCALGHFYPNTLGISPASNVCVLSRQLIHYVSRTTGVLMQHSRRAKAGNNYVLSPDELVRYLELSSDKLYLADPHPVVTFQALPPYRYEKGERRHCLDIARSFVRQVATAVKRGCVVGEALKDVGERCARFCLENGVENDDDINWWIEKRSADKQARKEEEGQEDRRDAMLLEEDGSVRAELDERFRDVILYPHSRTGEMLPIKYGPLLKSLYGYELGQKVRVTKGEHNGRGGIILGVYFDYLWIREEESCAAVAFIGKNRREVQERYRLVEEGMESEIPPYPDDLANRDAFRVQNEELKAMYDLAKELERGVEGVAVGSAAEAAKRTRSQYKELELKDPRINMDWRSGSAANTVWYPSTVWHIAPFNVGETMMWEHGRFKSGDRVVYSQPGRIGHTAVVIGVHNGFLWVKDLQDDALIRPVTEEEKEYMRVTINAPLETYMESVYVFRGVVFNRSFNAVGRFGVYFGQKVIFSRGPLFGVTAIILGVGPDGDLYAWHVNAEKIINVPCMSRGDLMMKHGPSLVGAVLRVTPPPGHEMSVYRTVHREAVNLDTTAYTLFAFFGVIQGSTIEIVMGRFVGQQAVVMGAFADRLWVHINSMPSDAGVVPIMGGQYEVASQPLITVTEVKKKNSDSHRPFKFLACIKEVLEFDISDEACQHFGLLHGQRLRLGRSSSAEPEAIIVVGVYANEIWGLVVGEVAARPIAGANDEHLRVHYPFLDILGFAELHPFVDVLHIPGTPIVNDRRVRSKRQIISYLTNTPELIGFDITPARCAQFGLQAGDKVQLSKGKECIAHHKIGSDGLPVVDWEWRTKGLEGVVIGIFEHQLYIHINGELGAEPLAPEMQQNGFEIIGKTEILPATAHDLQAAELKLKTTEAADSVQTLPPPNATRVTREELNKVIPFLPPEKVEEVRARFNKLPLSLVRKVLHWMLSWYGCKLEFSDTKMDGIRAVTAIEAYFAREPVPVPSVQDWELYVQRYNENVKRQEESSLIAPEVFREIKRKAYSYKMRAGEGDDQPAAEAVQFVAQRNGSLRPGEFSRRTTVVPGVRDGEGGIMDDASRKESVTAEYEALLKKQEEQRGQQIIQNAIEAARNIPLAKPEVYVGGEHRYLRHTGEAVNFQTSATVCEPFGFAFGDELRYNSGDIAGTVVVILGVHDGQLWRYDKNDETPAAPFEGTTKTDITMLHPLTIVGQTEPRHSDPFRFPIHETHPQVIDITDQRCFVHGVYHGQRFIMRKPKTGVFCPPCDYTHPPIITIVGTDGHDKVYYATDFSGALHYCGTDIVADLELEYAYSGTVKPLSTDWPAIRAEVEGSGREKPTVVTMDISPATLARFHPGIAFGTPIVTPVLQGVQSSTRGFQFDRGNDRDRSVSYVVGCGNGILYVVVTGDSQCKAWRPKELLKAYYKSGGTLKDNTFTDHYRENCVVEPLAETPDPDVFSFRVRYAQITMQLRPKIRGKNALGTLCLFSTSDDTCVAFGLKHGDLVEFTTPAFAGRRAVIIGVRKDMLWKYDEGSAVATMFSHCRDYSDIANMYAPKIVDRVVVEEFTG